MTIPNDPINALVDYLAIDPDVISLAGLRVYGGELPAQDASEMPRYAVVIQSAGGSGRRGESPQYNKRIDVFTYGATPAEAEYLQLACTGALNRVKRNVINNTILYSAIHLAGSYPGRSQDSYWPFSFSTWSVETNYQNVT